MKNFMHVLLAISVVACSESEPNTNLGTSTGNALALLASSRGELSMTPSGSDTSGTLYTVETASAYVREINLEHNAASCAELEASLSAEVTCYDSGNDGDKVELRIAGPFLFDLIARTSTPSLANLTLPTGTYSRIDVRFDDAESQEGIIDDNHPIAEQTLIGSGTFTYENVVRTFDLALKFNEDARFENNSGIEIQSDNNDIFLLLDVQEWFSGLPITDCLDDGDLSFDGNHLQIADDSGSCSDIENSIKEAIKRSGQLDRKDR